MKKRFAVFAVYFSIFRLSDTGPPRCHSRSYIEQDWWHELTTFAGLKERILQKLDGQIEALYQTLTATWEQMRTTHDSLTQACAKLGTRRGGAQEVAALVGRDLEMKTAIVGDVRRQSQHEAYSSPKPSITSCFDSRTNLFSSYNTDAPLITTNRPAAIRACNP
ncbi:hypothetical protein PAPYR_10176 [Paratrimastix pyriformis]|uniref:Uncharacterized protein n=1 Tax=Paratrimastix pyriformis TaxID=342808 RepID=A0ABQ8U6L0_9EUKA|nr:hypothetical protein PAPYR_10176 [Paratrimastix pyriformis]